MSYTDEQSALIVSRYEAAPSRDTVDNIARDIGKSTRSVIAKLAAAGVYQTPKRTTKTGDDIVKKETLVAEVGSWLGIEIPTLVKTGKLDLIALHKAIKEICAE